MRNRCSSIVRSSLFWSSALLLAAAPLAAQPEAESPGEGLWYGLSAGAGWDRMSCGICAGERRPGLSASVRAGGTLNPGLLLGGEAGGWSNSSGGVDEFLGSFGAVLFWFPDPAGPIHLKGGFGYLSYRAEDAENFLSTTAFGPQVGVGYDFRVGRTLALTPSINCMITPFGDLTFNDTRVRGDVRSSFIQVGVGLTWY
jgi:hypothetical protein